MSVLDKISYYQNRRDEIPNQELAQELARTKNKNGVKEIAENLWNKNKNIQSDCLKVLYEIGYLKPDLIADYVDDFLKLLKSKNNRMVWGAMIALATIAEKKPREIFANIDDVVRAVDQGSLITVVWGVKTLGRVASTGNKCRQKIFPILIAQLRKCIPRDVPMHAESILPAIDADSKSDFLSLLESRKTEMTAAQLARLKKVTKRLENK